MRLFLEGEDLRALAANYRASGSFAVEVSQREGGLEGWRLAETWYSGEGSHRGKDELGLLGNTHQDPGTSPSV